MTIILHLTASIKPLLYGLLLFMTLCANSSAANKNLDIEYYAELVSNNPNKVINELSPYIKNSPEDSNIDDLLQAHYLIINAHYFLSERDKITPVAEAGLEIAEQYDRDEFIAKFLGMLAIATLNTQNYSKATQIAQQASETARSLGDNTPLLGEVLMLEAHVHYESGAIKDALRTMVAADKIFSEVGDNKNRSEAIASIALMYDELGQPKQAIEYHLKSLELINPEESLIEASITYYNIALTYRHQEDLELAKKYSSLSLQYAERANDSIGAAYANYELAMIDEAEQNYQSALSKINPVIPLFKDSNITGMIILSHLLRARLKAHLSLGDWQSDIAIAEELVDKKGSLKRRIALTRSKAKIYDLIDEPTKARDNYRDWVELNKEQIEETQEQATRRYQAMFELKEAESENKLLSAQKKLAETELKARESRQWMLVSLTTTMLLISAIVFYILIMQIRTKQKFKTMAMIDELTQTRNRRSITAFANQAIEQARDQNNDLCFALIDIDKFKSINDSFGHDVGDEVLKKVASAVSQELRTGDALGRWGGEEWLLVLPNNSADKMHKVFSRIQQSLNNKDFNLPESRKVTISMGSTSLKSEDSSLEDVVKRADNALYDAKDAGRNCMRTS